MNHKFGIKLAVDVFMTVTLFFLMGYQFWGKAAHEWIGTVTFVFFVFHHVLNGRWHKALFKGSYSALRILTLCVDCLVLVCILVQMCSSIVISRYVFNFLPFDGGMSVARRLHILGAYWGFILMSLHLGIHWNVILGIVVKATGLKGISKAQSVIAFLAGLLVSAYGVWAFISRDFLTYLLLKSEFVFLDYNEPKFSFYIDYLALMVLCIFMAHYGAKIVRKVKKKLKIK